MQLSPFLGPETSRRLIAPFFRFRHPRHLLPRQVDLLQLLHLLMLPLLEQNIVVIQIPITRVPVHPSPPPLRLLKLPLQVVQVLNILKILDIPHLKPLLVIIKPRRLLHYLRLESI